MTRCLVWERDGSTWHRFGRTMSAPVARTIAAMIRSSSHAARVFELEAAGTQENL